MDCEQALEAVSAALDGELTAKERVELEAHLSVCPACRALAEDFSLLNAALMENEHAPPQMLAEQVMERIAGENKVVPISSGRRPGQRRWMGLAAALALVVCAGGLGVWQRGDHGDTGAPMAYSNSNLVPVSGSAGNSGGTEEEAQQVVVDDELCDVSAEPASNEGEKPAPAMAAPSVVPSAKTSGPGDGWQETVENYTPYGPAAPADPAEGRQSAENGTVVVSSEEALELVFEHLGGYESFPAAQLRYTTVYGALTPAYCLRTQTVGDTELSEYCLDYVRLSANALYHEIRLYEAVTDLVNASNSTNTFNWFAVDVDGRGEILEEFPPDCDAECAGEYIDSYQNTITDD